MPDLSVVTVLHVDDNEENRYVVNRLLFNAGYRVVEAATGAAALQAVTEQSPDLIILDVKLPDFDGFEVCRRLKANSLTASIPILHLSATFVDSQYKAEGLDSGADAYLAQPVAPIELLATMRALLRIRRAEEAALLSAREWQTTFDAINDSVGLLDREGKFLRCNTAMTILLNKPLGEILGCQHEELLQTSLGCIATTPLRQVQAKRQRESVEIECRDRWFLIILDPILNEQQAFTGAVFILSDVSDRKRAEAEREKLLTLEKEARAQAEQANRLKDDFLATLSHELRSPLNAILGWTQLLSTGKFDAVTTAKGMETIERNAKAQVQLVEDLLDVSRIIQGKMRLNVQPLEPIGVIAAAIETVRPAAEAKTIRLQSVLDPGAGPIAGDGDRLQQVIWNLLSNAVKFTPKGGRVQVRLERINSHVEIIVSDTGQGINPDFLPYLFERFTQADSSTTRAYTGLGLGLALVRHLVELHGGTVLAQSPGKGQGATFTVKLPLLPVQVEVNDETRVHPSLGQSLPFDNAPNLSGICVILVDDEVDAREFLVFTLKQCGAEVIAVATAQEALAAVTQLQAQVLVSDIGMPEEDGYSLIRKVRALKEGGQIPSVALTAYARTEDRTRAIAAGFQLHLSKPVDPAELATVVASLAKASSGG